MTDIDAGISPAEEDVRVSEAGESENVEADYQADQTEEGAEGAEPNPDDDLVEVELDGQKFKVPKPLKNAVMARTDYSKKTAEVAELRRTLEQQSSQTIQAEADEIQLVGRVTVLQDQIKAFDQVDWDALESENPDQANRLWRQREQIKDAYQRAGSELVGKQQARSQRQALATAEARFNREKALADPETGIKGWGPELGGKLTTFAQSAFGLSPQEVDAQTDPRAIRVLHRAFSLEQENASLRKQLGLRQQQDIKPAPRPGGSAGGAGRSLLDRAKNGDVEAVRKRMGELAQGR
jgi:hypothetical protein